MEKVKKLKAFHTYPIEKVTVIDDVSKEVTEEYYVAYDYKNRKLGTAKTTKEIHELIKENERNHGYVVDYQEEDLIDFAKPYAIHLLADNEEDALELAKIEVQKKNEWLKTNYVVGKVHRDWTRYFMK